MRHWEFFLPRKFLMTNAMLAALRAAGHYEGARGCRPKKGYTYDKFAIEAASIRRDVGYLVRAHVRPSGTAIPALTFSFVFIGHERFDGDAGLLPAKELVDGICAALGLASDRGVVRGVTVCNRTTERDSWVAFKAYLDGSLTPEKESKFGPGVLVYLTEVSP